MLFNLNFELELDFTQHSLLPLYFNLRLTTEY
jgi:hypothetical protein